MQSTTLAELLAKYVYTQLQDSDNHIRWTQDELTEYVNSALRDIVARRPEAGAVTDRAMVLREGKRQILPPGAIRLKEVIRNIPGIFGLIEVDQVGQQIVNTVGIAGLAGSVATDQPDQVVDIVADAVATLFAEIETLQFPQIPAISANHTSRFTFTPAYAAYTKTADGGAFRAKVAIYGESDHAERHVMHNVTGLTTGQADSNGALRFDSRLFNEIGTEITFETHAGVGATNRIKRYDLLAQANAGGSASLTEGTYHGVMDRSTDGGRVVVAARDTAAQSYVGKVYLFDASNMSLIATANTVPQIQFVAGLNYPFAVGGAWTRPNARYRPLITRDGTMVICGGFLCEPWAEDAGYSPFVMRFLLHRGSTGTGISRWSVPAMTQLTEPIVRASGYEAGATDLAMVPGTDIVLAVGRNSYVQFPFGGEFINNFLPELVQYFTVYDVIGQNLFQRALRITLPTAHSVEGNIAAAKKGQFGIGRNPCMFVSPDGLWCVILTDRASPWMTIVDLTTFTLVTALSGGNIPAGEITDCFYSGDGSQFLISTGSNVYSVYDTSTWTVSGTVTFPTGTKWVTPIGVDTFTLD